MHLDLTILQHELGKAALAFRKTVATPGGKEAESLFKKLVKVTSVAWQPHANATLHATLPNCWQGQHFGVLKLLSNEMKIRVNFWSPGLKWCQGQHFGSVACSVACSVA